MMVNPAAMGCRTRAAKASCGEFASRGTTQVRIL